MANEKYMTAEITEDGFIKLPEGAREALGDSVLIVNRGNHVVITRPVACNDYDMPIELIREGDGIQRKPCLGILKGKIWMSPDFDEPLEEMREYM